MTQQERLRYLVEGLVAEYKEKYNEHIDIPMNEEEQFNLFRALCNIRSAGSMPAEWMKIQDEYLTELARKKELLPLMIWKNVHLRFIYGKAILRAFQWML